VTFSEKNIDRCRTDDFILVSRTWIKINGSRFKIVYEFFEILEVFFYLFIYTLVFQLVFFKPQELEKKYFLPIFHTSLWFFQFFLNFVNLWQTNHDIFNFGPQEFEKNRTNSNTKSFFMYFSNLFSIFWQHI
jgi:hypothetical protein